MSSEELAQQGFNKSYKKPLNKKQFEELVNTYKK